MRLFPDTVRVCPTVACVEEIVSAEGGETKVNGAPDCPVPAIFVAVIKPVAPVETTRVTCVGEFMVKACAGTPPTLTAVTLPRFSPVSVTIELVAPVVGENELMIGSSGTVESVSETVVACKNEPALTNTRSVTLVLTSNGDNHATARFCNTPAEALFKITLAEVTKNPALSPPAPVIVAVTVAFVGESSFQPFHAPKATLKGLPLTIFSAPALNAP